MDSFVLSKDSPTTRVTINKKRLRLGGEAVELTKAEQQTLEEMGAKFEPATKSNTPDPAEPDNNS